MKNNSYSDDRIPNNYGASYTASNRPYIYVFENNVKTRKDFFGTVLGIFFLKSFGKAGNRKKLSKMGETGFAHNTDLKQTIKHGFILYIVIALLAVPAGVCSTQYLAFKFEPPVVAMGPEPDDFYRLIESPAFTMAADEMKREIARADEAAWLASLPPFYFPIMKASQEYEVDAALIRAIIMAESSNNPMAVSHRGAQGLMQLMPTTARWLGVDDAFNPELNIDGGVRYLKRLLDRFNGNVELALAAYNAGSRYVLKYGGVPPFRATHLYIKKVLQYQLEYQKEMVADNTGLTAV